MLRYALEFRSLQVTRSPGRGPILQNEPTGGGVSGGVGRSPWWPSGCPGWIRAQAAAAIRYIYTRTASVASFCARLISGKRHQLLVWAELEKPPPRCSSLLGRSARSARRAQSSKMNRLTVGYL